MKLGRHLILAIILAISLFLVVLAFPSQGQSTHPTSDIRNYTSGSSDIPDYSNYPSDNPKPECKEKWECAEWSDCLGGYKIRECVDRNHCGTFFERPVVMERCQTDLEETPCQEEWVCMPWQSCINGFQRRMCADVSACGTSLTRPEETRNCTVLCLEQWQCGQWSPCISGLQMRYCYDVSPCGNHLRINETKECTAPLPQTNHTQQNVTYPANATNQSTEIPHEPAPQNATNETQANVTATQNVTSNVTAPVQNQTSVQNQTQTQQNASGQDVPRAVTARVYSQIRIQEAVRMIIDEPESSISQLSIRTRNIVTDARIMVSTNQERPLEAPSVVRAGRGEVFNFIEIANSNINDEDIESATIDFRVSKEWVRDKRINVSSVRLSRLSGESWSSLETSLIDDDVDNFYFRAHTPGFSIFAIAGDYMLESTGGALCIPLDLRCYGREVQECDLDGLAWTIVSECENGCSEGGRCIEAGLAPGNVQGQNMIMVLLTSIIGIIAALGVFVVLFRIKRKKAVEDLGGGLTRPDT